MYVPIGKKMNLKEIEKQASKFTIGFNNDDREELFNYWKDILDTKQWSEGKYNENFESAWSSWNDLPSVSFSSWAGGAMAVLNFIDVKDQVVLCPSNTFMATPLSVINSGGIVEFVDINKEDLCMSFSDFKAKAEKFKPKAAWIVHIGGHISFEIEEISSYCQKEGIWLIEDCAHSHGAEWNGKKPGSWGDAGVYSMYATKTISTGEGGILVSKNEDIIEHAKSYRNYGKFDYKVSGLNFRLSEFSAALGVIQTNRMPEIVQWKNNYAADFLDKKYNNRLQLPEGMKSGYYKYIVFDEIHHSSGKVYDNPCHTLLNHKISLPNTEWIKDNHWCVPLYYHPEIEFKK